MRLTVIPTPKAVLLALAAAGSAWAGATLGVFALFAFAVGIATLLILGLLSMFAGGARSWKVARVLTPAMPQVGDSVSVEITAAPNRLLSPTLALFEPTPWGTRRLGLSSNVATKEPLRVSWNLTPTMRGLLRAGPGLLFRHDLLSLFRRRIADLPATEITVLPRTIRFDPEHLLRTMGIQAVGPAESSELHDMRTYVPGDDPRRVNWKASARTMSSGTLIVADNRSHGGRCEVRVRLDVDSLPPTEANNEHESSGSRELAISVAASIVAELATLSHDRVGRPGTQCVLEIYEQSQLLHRSDDAQKNVVVLALLESLERQATTDALVGTGSTLDAGPSNATILITGANSIRTAALTFRCISVTEASHSSGARNGSDPSGVLRGVSEISLLDDLPRIVADL